MENDDAYFRFLRILYVLLICPFVGLLGLVAIEEGAWWLLLLWCSAFFETIMFFYFDADIIFAIIFTKIIDCIKGGDIIGFLFFIFLCILSFIYFLFLIIAWCKVASLLSYVLYALF